MTAGSRVGSYMTESILLPKSSTGGCEEGAKDNSNRNSLFSVGMH